MPPQTPLQFPPLLDEVRNVLPEDIPAYLVGGAVRDAALGRAIHDLDFAVASGGLRLARRVADSLHAHFYPLDRERDTGRVVIIQPDNSRLVLDFASFRGP
ncbi:MAG: hypothetical protein FJZ96_13315, partial [Chloroflexi bacterium]|nr:hypothetical protein [Chloroflexota bacterium]